MALPPDQTTPLSNAINNAATQAADIATDLGARTEGAASYLAQAINNQIPFDAGVYNAHLANVGLGMVEGFYAWMATMTDNISLLVDDVSVDFTSEVIENLGPVDDFTIESIEWGGAVFPAGRGALVAVGQAGCCFHITNSQFDPAPLFVVLRHRTDGLVNNGTPFELSMGVRFPEG